jgi:solute:Na+ symporter, SSS family
MNIKPVAKDRWSLGRFFTLLVAALTVAAPLSARAASDPPQVTPSLRERSVSAIRQVFDREQQWVKVHAAEYLISLDYLEGVKEAFVKELDIHGGEPQYRIGIWRVLAQAASSERERAEWIGKIRDVFMDRAAPDRINAAETLAKLRYKVRDDETDNETAAMEQAAQPENGRLALYAAWVLVNSARPGAEGRLVERLDSPDADARLGAAYAMRYLPSVSPSAREKLLAVARREPATSKARVYVIAAAAVHAPPDDRSSLKSELADFAAKGDKAERFQACQTLAQIGDNSDLSLLGQLLDDPNPDLRATAADAILRIGRRVPHHLVIWDWAVIAVYALGMLAVGWYYSRRTKTGEQYLLGDRKMSPLMVGISLFASLISVIGYLAWPGEMIKYGPMMFSGALAYPLIYLVVGWLMIPYIMRLRVTSAYEILELRLGSTVRTLGSLLFLSMRLLWMAVILYAATSKVLVPLLGLDPRTGPIVCAMLALVTIVYTAMGGLRAVVVTDVIQSGILFGAAIVTVTTISIGLGGVQAWWPSQWPAHWPVPQYGYDPSARATMFGAVLAAFTWNVCISASDQICVQRYLSTKDARAARTVMWISLVASTFVSILLAFVGLGLLAYFQTFPHLLPDTQTVLSDGDKLFPQFIVTGLPVGLSGLVVAGLLACAMSAFSAGINSTCSVITIDIIDRLRGKNKTAESGRVRQMKYVSVLVGVIVVFLSLFVYLVQGNLLEVTYKVVNLLTAPLAGLFFLAMFVPWARGFGAMVGAVCGLTVVVAVNFWKEITGVQGISFLWAMPLSLMVEVGVGALVSLIPIGRRKPIPIA